MKVFKVDINNPDIKIIEEAAEVLSSGGIVIHPTDTSYGLAANIFDDRAIKRIYEIKGRDFNKPLINCVRDLKMAEEIVVFNDLAYKLFDKFFPGALTLVLKSKDDLGTRAIRIPYCKVTQELSKICLFPYSTTSANISGQADEYSPNFNLKVDLVLDAGQLPIKPPSTVIDVSSGEVKILREGAISKDLLLGFVG